MYKTSGKIDEEVLKETGKYVIPYKSRRVFQVLIDFFCVLFFILIIFYKILPAAIMLAFAAFFWRLQIKAQKRCRETMLQGLGGAGAHLTCTSEFDEKKITVWNEDSSQKQKILYFDVNEMAVRQKFFFLSTRDGQLIYIFRKQLPNEKKFLDFLFSQKSGISLWTKLQVRFYRALTAR